MLFSLDIHGVACDVDSAPALADMVGAVVRHIGLPVHEQTLGEPAPRLTVRVRQGEPPELPAGPPTLAHANGYLRVWRTDGEAVLRTRATTTVVQSEAGTADCMISPTALSSGGVEPEVVVAFVTALFLMLRPHGLFPLHAAALARGPDGLLLAAPSDSGKSTTAYALVRQGWSFLSDDSVLLRTDGADVEALAFRRTFGLDVGGAVAFPELAGIAARQLSDPAKRAVPVESLYPEQAQAACRPRVLLFPQIEDCAESQLEPMPKADALIALAGQSALVAFEPARAARHMDVLRRLVDQARPYRMYAGRDLLTAPERIADLIAPVWPETLDTPFASDLAAHE